MKKLFLIISLLSICLACKSQDKGFTSYIVGDDESVGAQVYCNDKLIGEMKEHIQNVDTNYVKKGDINAIATLKIPKGQNLIAFVSKKGKKLTKEIDVHTQVYLVVEFKKMRIRN